MGQQLKARIKRRRRADYLERKKTAAKAVVKPAPKKTRAPAKKKEAAS